MSNPTNAPIQSHLLKAVATHLAARQEFPEGVEMPPSEKLLEQLFFQHALILSSINSSLELANKVRDAMAIEVARMREVPPEPKLIIDPTPAPSNIIRPEFFKGD